MLVLEDFDRCSMFDTNYYGESKDSKVNISTILNELDGVAESYGRSLWITANDKSRFKNVKGINALFRPGRVDKTVELPHCTPKQIQKIVKQFINVDIKLEDIGDQQITPAQLISLLQKNMDSEEMIMEFKSKICNENLSTLAANEKIDTNVNSKKNRRSRFRRFSVVNRRKRKIKLLQYKIKQSKKDFANIKVVESQIRKQKKLLKKSIEAENKRKIKERQKAKREKLLAKQKKQKKQKEQKEQQLAISKKRKNPITSTVIGTVNDPSTIIETVNDPSTIIETVNDPSTIIGTVNDPSTIIGTVNDQPPAKIFKPIRTIGMRTRSVYKALKQQNNS